MDEDVLTTLAESGTFQLLLRILYQRFHVQLRTRHFVLQQRDAHDIINALGLRCRQISFELGYSFFAFRLFRFRGTQQF